MGDGEGKASKVAAKAEVASMDECHLANVSSAIAGGVAHEVNNPLTYVLANLNVIGSELAAGSAPTSLRHQALLAEAIEGLLRIRDVVRDLAVFSRKEPSPSVDLQEVVAATVHIIRAEIEAHSDFEVSLRGVPPVRGSAAHLAQLLLSVLIHGSQRLIARSGDRVGQGRRGSMALVGHRVGTGMAEVSMTLGGYVPAGDEAGWLETEQESSPCLEHAIRSAAAIGAEFRCERADTPKGPGCVFHMRLPAALSLVDRLDDQRPSVSNGRLRVLVVDDEPMIRQLFTTELLTHDFTRVSSGRDAIAVLGTERFDAVFCDLIMQDVDGIGVYDYVRRHRPTLLAQFVVMTAGGFTSAAQQFLESVPVPVLHKPFTCADVRDVLARFRPALVAT